ncbi:hypothetical protein PoB_005734100 [Plakobranchus ocellatus]|uniref:Uncharacterized protein n=1 Tax=Plakobranchus ocellatus TaxID=259542 RepID=A0AAV4C686_9GAST|nr:hypothetical protein PoB_005734100 [Plakobranchus ocellatus]
MVMIADVRISIDSLLNPRLQRDFVDVEAMPLRRQRSGANKISISGVSRGWSECYPVTQHPQLDMGRSMEGRQR